MKSYFFLPLLFPLLAFAELKVVTTVPDLSAIAAEVGGSYVTSQSIAKGTQDPHFIEAKPSFMVTLSKADLFILIGLDLEVGWAPSLIQGARNPKIASGVGRLEVGPSLDPLEVPTGKVTRSEGDVHPFGNPHVTEDPIRAGKIAQLIAERLAQLDPAHAVTFRDNANKLQKRMTDKTAEWKKRIAASGVKDIVTFHKTLTYFLDRFGLGNPAILEPKPGIPPTASHILDVIKIIKEKSVKVLLLENYFDAGATNKIVKEVPTLKVRTVAVLVGGSPEVKTIDDLYEQLVKAVIEK